MTDDITNETRAGWVADAIEQFAEANYHGGDYLHTIVQDFITDLGHLLDMLAHVDVIEVDPNPPPFEDVFSWAWSNYIEEKDEEELECQES